LFLGLVGLFPPVDFDAIGKLLESLVGCQFVAYLIVEEAPVFQ
jgi:hypothetical protein